MDDVETFRSLYEHGIIGKVVYNSIDENFKDHKELTAIQRETIPAILAGKNILASAPTGSGKTLAFVLPAVQILHKLRAQQRQGTRVLVLSPTRELAEQTFNVAQKLCVGRELGSIKIAKVIGGDSRDDQLDRIKKGAHIVVATPGRLKDIITHNKEARDQFSNLLMLIVDETDRLLDEGFKPDLELIVRTLPATEAPKQTLMFSATQTNNVTELAALFCTTDIGTDGDMYSEDAAVTLTRINVGPPTEAVTHANLTESYVPCEYKHRFAVLYKLLKQRKAKNHKTIVYVSSCAAVKFYYSFLNVVRFYDPAKGDSYKLFRLFGDMKQSDRRATYNEFRREDSSGVLVTTDVAARGVDFPDVDWVIQLDPPNDRDTYIHRVGRACRGASTRKANALIFLTEAELSFLGVLEVDPKTGARTTFMEWGPFTARPGESAEEKEKREGLIARIDKEARLLVALGTKKDELRKLGKEAMRSFLTSYDSRSMKDIFNIDDIDDMVGVANSFGLAQAPQLSLPSVSLKKAKNIKKKRLNGARRVEPDY
ncbi:DEAD/DEAH box helicase [Carpediemonas membranifera]|uniref:ATP-dependent RNA helicase n=1 Tax=Carpediemonas membranifera TaxID=201153 RepID=A0A8J6AVJ7_9EUKA|nr:DEAD/DEAH box helicase [Carpediemonas membranifera]|eukprot:KAG9393590.1 DEAD/DEAH box helicase [Carpediemonas membranifera]